MIDQASPDRPPFPVEAEVLAVLESLWRAGHAAFLVGGGVRDALLGLPLSDWDVATDARPERILAIFPGSDYQNRFGTVLARGVEITTFRRDHHYADHRRPNSVTFSEDVYEDLARRDLTINAIAWGRPRPDASPRFVDPADGRGDLKARLVRAVGDPHRRFDEDALRLLRAVRIAARLDFDIESVTKQAMFDNADDIAWVSEERLGDEVRRMLTAPTPSRAIRLMAETGILAATLPEFDGLPGATQEHHLAALDTVTRVRAGDERLALAALFGAAGPEVARATLERLRVAGRDVDAVTALVALAPTPYGDDWSDADVRRYMARVAASQLDDLLVLRAALAEGDDGVGAAESRLHARVRAQCAAGVPLTLGDLAIDGRDLRETLDIPEGPTIGVILERLLADVIDDPRLNARTTLLARASLMLEQLSHDGPNGAGRPAIG